MILPKTVKNYHHFPPKIVGLFYEVILQIMSKAKSTGFPDTLLGFKSKSLCLLFWQSRLLQNKAKERHIGERESKHENNASGIKKVTNISSSFKVTQEI